MLVGRSGAGRRGDANSELPTFQLDQSRIMISQAETILARAVVPPRRAPLARGTKPPTHQALESARLNTADISPSPHQPSAALYRAINTTSNLSHSRFARHGPRAPRLSPGPQGLRLQALPDAPQLGREPHVQGAAHCLSDRLTVISDASSLFGRSLSCRSLTDSTAKVSPILRLARV